MKMVSIQMARSIWLFSLSEFNPKGLNLWPALEFLIARYRFAIYPKNLLDLDAEKALSFKGGAFTNSKKDQVYVSLTVYNNGLMAETASSTDDSDEFLQEAAGLASKEFGLTVPKNLTRAYVSQMEVESDFALQTFSPRLAFLAQVLSDAVPPSEGKMRQFGFGAFQLWAEDWNPATAPAYFRFERKVGAPFSSNRYFSQAPLKTKEHLEFLKELERVLGGESL